ncbi:hypothetical protein TanjilG_03302 [Lupinus angustifolius]|uniref:ENTH domain-containing protein n=1 Tax=Lupinus angustifolius TaxID=3871 RepID=A0A4P1RDG9_LUPAN|nr:PREDICTED: epsin-2-like [Lupinus angustifolius]OIW08626.1 hypothetical protein TanjilG_03302 [Lupinus angustifolius]
MSTPLFYVLKKQASFFLKEKIKTARLAFSDVTPAELMTEEATNGNPLAPDTPTLISISKAAFDVDDYWRIVEILHKRLLKFEKNNWRASYNSLIVLEHMLTHGPESVAEEFQCDKDVINQLKGFQYIDDTGFNWGLAVRKKSGRIMKLLEEGTLLKEERNRARSLTRGIQGFGSYDQRSSTAQGILREKSLPTTFGRCNSEISNQENHVNMSYCSYNSMDTTAINKYPNHSGGIFKSLDTVETKSYQDDPDNNQMLQRSETSSEENMEPGMDKFHLWKLRGESNLLLDCNDQDSKLGHFIAEDDHPFNSTTEMHSTASLISCYR